MIMHALIKRRSIIKPITILKINPPARYPVVTERAAVHTDVILSSIDHIASLRWSQVPRVYCRYHVIGANPATQDIILILIKEEEEGGKWKCNQYKDVNFFTALKLSYM